MTSVATTVDLTDPSFWATEDCHQVLRALRHAAPVHLIESAEEGPLWCVLSHQLASAVLNDATTFSSQKGSLLGAGKGKTPAGAGKMMALTDPPKHRDLRRLVMPFFTKSKAAELTPRVHQLTAGVVRAAMDRGDTDFVRGISTTTPLTVMCDLIGVPEDDRDHVVRLCDAAFLGDTAATRSAAHQNLLPYLFQLALRRRADPREDIISTLATHRIDGDLLPLEEVLLNCDNILVGGIQTVRHTATMAMLALIDHPEAWAELGARTCDSALAVEELLRWTSVGLHVLRTATRDVELAGRKIRSGDRVVVWPPAANRDETEFDAPTQLNLRRSPNRHLAFGWGPHYCIGAPLARVELAGLFTTLAHQAEHPGLQAPPRYNQSIINFGLDTLEVRLSPRP
ncbi:cytochrome P450 [Amycolatopsis sp. WQ 127309]|uniref:cytochrome P450 n=1 Tax=Amycolatopsis sp. WQ 127309 TaxID=2932773 RepID=UPI001FF426B7|nr:cytochrome P450 [Amycolatopsis sp. WQ 127309]UOZ05568.1 cytochrome P450 [Amycolatopsis sp. WQ 127309]